jgi:hypothetical protein
MLLLCPVRGQQPLTLPNPKAWNGENEDGEEELRGDVPGNEEDIPIEGEPLVVLEALDTFANDDDEDEDEDEDEYKEGLEDVPVDAEREALETG